MTSYYESLGTEDADCLSGTASKPCVQRLRQQMPRGRRLQLAAVWIKDALHLRTAYVMTSPSVLKLHRLSHGWLSRLLRKTLILLQLLLTLWDEDARWPFVLELGICTVNAVELYLRSVVMGTTLFRQDGWVRLKVLALTATVTNDVASLLFFGHSHTNVLRVFRVLFAIECSRQLRSNFVYLAKLFPRLLAGHLLLLFSYILIFSLLAVGVFPDVAGFRSTKEAAISLFMTLTTVVFPSISLPLITRSPAFAIFFVIFLSVGIFLVLNLLLALVVVYYKQYLQHDFIVRLKARRRLASLCFHLLCDDPAQGIAMAEFDELMRRIYPFISNTAIQRVFDCIDHDMDGVVFENEFSEIFDVLRFELALKHKNRLVFMLHNGYEHVIGSLSSLWPIQRRFDGFVSNRIFSSLVTMLLVVNLVSLLVELELAPAFSAVKPFWLFVSLTITLLLVLETALLLFAKGVRRFFSDMWMTGNFFIALSLSVCLLLEFSSSSNHHFVTLCLRLLSCTRLVLSIRQVRTLLALTLYMLPIFAVNFFSLFLILYVFAMIGRALYGGLLVPNQPLLLGSLYDKEDFYAVNFNTVSSSLFVLFHFMIVNDWHVTMSGMRAVTSDWSVLFFVAVFLTVNLTVLNVVVALFVESFSKYFENETSSKHIVAVDVSEHSEISNDSFRESAPSNRNLPAPKQDSVLDWKFTGWRSAFRPCFLAFARVGRVPLTVFRHWTAVSNKILDFERRIVLTF